LSTPPYFGVSAVVGLAVVLVGCVPVVTDGVAVWVAGFVVVAEVDDEVAAG
jgi:hypothetical protein